MKLSHCICPQFLSSNIGNDSTFLKVFIERFVLTDDQIILDQEERLAKSYIESVELDEKALTNYISWRKMLEVKDAGKTLLSSSSNATSPEDTVYNAISAATTTFGKVIVAEDNNHYAKFINQINRQRIQLYNLNNFTSTSKISIKKKPEHAELESDLEWILQRLVRRAEKEDSEDYNNDYIRDMLDSKQYEVRDQTREGSSMSGAGAGELDLVVEDQGVLFSLIEAMKLNSVDTNYINGHYTKLLDNYNPLEVKRTFLISYYYGANFLSWWGRYKQHIANLNINSITRHNYTSSQIVEHPTDFGSVKKLHHHLESNGEHSLCTHLAIRLGK